MNLSLTTQTHKNERILKNHENHILGIPNTFKESSSHILSAECRGAKEDSCEYKVKQVGAGRTSQASLTCSSSPRSVAWTVREEGFSDSFTSSYKWESDGIALVKLMQVTGYQLPVSSSTAFYNEDLPSFLESDLVVVS